jgi:capsule polysaccharide export protein KpsC/LpsZ
MDDRHKIIKALSLDPSKKVYSLFTNLTWDAAIVNKGVCFSDMWEWVKKTIIYAKDKPDIQLIIRVHPAEIHLYRKTLERVGDLIRSEFPEFPPNVRVVDSESPVSSYALAELSDKVLVFTSTVGLEAAVIGKKVIVCARAYYRDKGFTIDPDTEEEYFKELDSDLPIAKKSIMEKAQRYAYAFFFDTHIPFNSVCEEEKIGDFHFKIRSLDELFKKYYPETIFFKQFPFENRKGFLKYLGI